MLIDFGFRQRLRRGEVVFGPLVQSSCASLVEVLGLGGFDFVLLDQEHGAISIKDVESAARAGKCVGIPCLVRLRNSSATEITAVLDTGVGGVHVPHVNSADTARLVVDLSRFHPDGKRGLNPFVRAAGFSAQPVGRFISASNEEVTVVISVEGLTAITHLDEILKVEGIDAVFLGPYDLSNALGFPGEISHPNVVRALGTAIRQITAAGKAAGIFTSTVEDAEIWIQRGVQYVVFSVDSKLLLDIAQERVQKLRSLAEISMRQKAETGLWPRHMEMRD
jgi:4-hydroxy-2-oxoheptanedioate aldolase